MCKIQRLISNHIFCPCLLIYGKPEVPAQASTWPRDETPQQTNGWANSKGPNETSSWSGIPTEPRADRDRGKGKVHVAEQTSGWDNFPSQSSGWGVDFEKNEHPKETSVTPVNPKVAGKQRYD